MKVLIVYYSTYGNVYKMAQLVAAGVAQVAGAEPVIRTVPELIPAGVFVSTGSLHGGQETTILTLMAPLLHLGMILVGVPYSVQELFTTTSGGSPYGPGHLAGGDNSNEISSEEATICRAFGRRLAEVGKQLLKP